MRVLLTNLEFEMMVDLEDNWIEPPLPYPIWSLDREEKVLHIYNTMRYKEVLSKYYSSKGQDYEEQSKNSAYADGFTDGLYKLARKNASDFWAWNAHDYYRGYDRGFRLTPKEVFKEEI